jgi:Ca2+-binding RTX toxin-like protein
VRVIFVRQVTEVNERLNAGNHLKLAVIFGDGSDTIIFNDFPAPSDNDVALVLRDGTLSSGQLLRLAHGNPIIEGSGGFSAIETSGSGAEPPGSASPLTLTGTNDGDTIIGASGADRLYGNEGINVLNGKAGSDTIAGGNINDSILGEDGNDIGYGNGGDDLIIGGAGADKLYGAGGDDLIFGDDGKGVDLPSTWLVPPGHGISAKMEIVRSWWGGFEAQITVAANESVGQWQLALRSHFKINDFWGAQKADEAPDPGGTIYTLGNAGWNGSLANGQTTTIGFTASTNVPGDLSASDILRALALSTDGVPAALPPMAPVAPAPALPPVPPPTSFETTSDFTLPADALTVTAVGTANVKLIGNDLSNTIIGNDGRNTINAGGGNDIVAAGRGNDVLTGGLGLDVLTGGAGKDAFVFNTRLGTAKTDRKVNFDTIKDFSIKDDSIQLDNAIFRKLGSKGSENKPVKLNKDFFSFDKAKDKNDYVVYNKKTGVVSYDADGSGAKAAVEFALVKKGTNLKYDDFFVV